MILSGLPLALILAALASGHVLSPGPAIDSEWSAEYNPEVDYELNPEFNPGVYLVANQANVANSRCYEHDGRVIYCLGDDNKTTTTITLVPETAAATATTTTTQTATETSTTEALPTTTLYVTGEPLVEVPRTTQTFEFYTTLTTKYIGKKGDGQNVTSQGIVTVQKTNIVTVDDAKPTKQTQSAERDEHVAKAPSVTPTVTPTVIPTPSLPEATGLTVIEEPSSSEDSGNDLDGDDDQSSE